MSSLNKIILIGKLLDDPEIRVTTEGTSLTKFALSVDRSFGEAKADVINIVNWGKLAEQAANEFKKDTLALVEGRIQVRTYDDKDGEKVWATEVVSSFIKIIGSAGVSSQASSAVEEEFTEDDIPF